MAFSLQSRLLLVSLAILLGFAVLTGLALDRAFRESAETALQDRLRGYMFALLAATEVTDDGKLSLSRELPDARFNQPGSGLYALVRHADNTDLAIHSKSVLGTNLLLPERPATGQGRFKRLTSEQGTTLYFYTYAARWQTDQHLYPLTYFIATDMQSYFSQINNYRHNLWGWLLAATLLLLLAQALVLRWGLRPLRRVARDLAAIESGRRSQLDDDYPSELRGLTRNLNLLLETTRRQLNRYRDGLGNVSHSLKTPLTVLRGLFSKPGFDPEQATSAGEQLDRMQQIIDYHLQRAATAGPVQPGKVVTIKPVIQRIVDSLHKSRQEKPVEVLLEVPDAVTFHGDEDDLYEVLGNLLDNAFKWCQTKITVRALNSASGHLTLVIEDDGPGIPGSVRQQVLERGARLDPNIEGHGLGLAMVQETVRIYGGQIEIGTSPDGGASITIELPAEPRIQAEKTS